MRGVFRRFLGGLRLACRFSSGADVDGILRSDFGHICCRLFSLRFVSWCYWWNV